MPVSINGNGTITGLVITTADLADGSVTTAKIAAGAVETADIADSAVTTAKIANSNVTGAKLEDSGVTAGTYTTATVTVDAKGRVTSASSGSTGVPAYLAVGSLAWLFNFSRSGVVAGNNVTSSSSGYQTNAATPLNASSGIQNVTTTTRTGNVTVPGAGSTIYYSTNTTAVSGTWRALSSATASTYDGCPNLTYAYAFLAVRIA